MTDEKNIGDIFNEERKRQGITVEELSYKSGIVEPTLKNILSNRTKAPRRDTLERIANALNIPIEQFINKSDEVDMQAITEMKEIHQKHLDNVREHYERHLSDLKAGHAKMEEHYEKRLADKREVITEMEKHIETIKLDKKFFRIGFFIVLAVFLTALIGLSVAELMHPQHGWLRY